MSVNSLSEGTRPEVARQEQPRGCTKATEDVTATAASDANWRVLRQPAAQRSCQPRTGPEHAPQGLTFLRRPETPHMQVGATPGKARTSRVHDLVTDAHQTHHAGLEITVSTADAGTFRFHIPSLSHHLLRYPQVRHSLPTVGRPNLVRCGRRSRPGKGNQR